MNPAALNRYNYLRGNNLMTAEIESLVLEHLRAIRGDIADMKQRLDRMDLRLSVMEQTLGGLYALSASDRETLQTVIHRVERIEQRLELAEHH